MIGILIAIALLIMASTGQGIAALFALLGGGSGGANPERPKPENGESDSGQAEFESWLRSAMWTPKTQYLEFVNGAAIRFGVPNALIESVLWVESADGRYTQGSAGEIGAMQILPTTVADIKRRMPSTAALNPQNIQDNILLGTAYLRLNYAQLGSWRKATIAYNAGAGSSRVYNATDWYFERVLSRLMEVLANE